MNVRSSVIIGVVMLLLPHLSYAQNSAFDLFYNATENETSESDLPPRFTDYVIEEMETWRDEGIILTSSDIDAAIKEELWRQDGTGLCQNKRSATGREYIFLQGGNDTNGSCMGLLNDILSIINREREMESLAVDLLSIAGGVETSIADEPSRPIDMAQMAMVLRRVWSGTGAAVIPWDRDWNPQLNALDGVLGGLSEKSLDEAVIRFRHGYFRDEDEADPRFNNVQNEVHDKLEELADRLGITGDPSEQGVYAVPRLQTKNVAVWIRKDDLGLLYTYPTHFPRFKLEKADQYPERVDHSFNLAYPFEYSGTPPGPSGGTRESPLCSRFVGKNGYLCRPVLAPSENCPTPGNPDAITLTLCEEKIFRTQSGPRICPDFNKIFENAASLADPANPAQLNPALVVANTGSLCTPETKVLYQDDIESHACYIGFCLKQSLSGNTLIPNRSPAVINEATSPYLACVRPDPQLGLYTEIVEESPYPLPEYVGLHLVRDYERLYCSTTGNAPQPLPGLCTHNDFVDSVLPQRTGLLQFQFSKSEELAVRYRQNSFDIAAVLIGQKVAIDQSVEVQRKVFAKLANFIQQTANLLLELENGLPTKTACPWTGQFKSSSSSAP